MNRRGAEDAEEEGGEAEVWFNRGVEQFEAGDFEGAIASYDEAIKIKPDLHEVWYNRGLVLANLGQYSEAIISWDKAIKSKSDNYLPWFNRGNALYFLRRIEEGIASYDKAVEIKPDYHEAWINRGVAAGELFSYNPFPSTISAITIQNPALNQRGYKGELASYQGGLKHCQQHPAKHYSTRTNQKRSQTRSYHRDRWCRFSHQWFNCYRRHRISTKTQGLFSLRLLCITLASFSVQLCYQCPIFNCFNYPPLSALKLYVYPSNRIQAQSIPV
jgi:tetratricopeptide (TPR) repeat protein